MRGQAAASKAISLVGCGYVMGATGWICTQARLERQAKQYPKYAKAIFKYGPKWIGKRCFDCAQLTREAQREDGVVLPSGATSQWHADVWRERGTMAKFPPDEPGIQLFQADGNVMKHTGISAGDGTAVEALGHASGVVRRSVSSGSWTHWARPRYPGEEGGETMEHTKNTLRKGVSGSEVVELQELLMAAGYQLPLYGADGHLGNETEQAVRAFQLANGLAVDGVVGAKTWAALLPYQRPAEPEARRWIVEVTGYNAGDLTGEQAVNLVDEYIAAGYTAVAKEV